MAPRFLTPSGMPVYVFMGYMTQQIVSLLLVTNIQAQAPLYLWSGIHASTTINIMK